MSRSPKMLDEADEVTETFEILDLKDDDKEEMISYLQVMKENATENESHKPYYIKAWNQIKDIANNVKKSGKRAMPVDKLTDLMNTFNDYHRKLGYHGKPPRIALIGELGVGKSSFGNILLEDRGDDDRFWTSPSAESCTQVLNEQEGHWFRDKERSKITVIDTPGLNDPKMTDEQRIVTTIEGLRKTPYITAFVLVINGSAPRFTEAHKQMIHAYRSVFGINLFTNMVIVFTHWPMDECSKATRRATQQSEELKRNDINARLREIFETTHEIPCCFVDSISYKYEITGWEETQEAVQSFSRFVENMVPYLTVEVKKLQRTNQDLEIALTELMECVSNLEQKEKDKELGKLKSQVEMFLKKRQLEEAASRVKTCSDLILPNSTNPTILEAEVAIKEQERKEEAKSLFQRVWGWIKENPGKVVLGAAAVGAAIVAAIVK